MITDMCPLSKAVCDTGTRDMFMVAGEIMQAKLDYDSGTLGFAAPGWDSVKLKSCKSKEEQVAASTILDTRLTFRDKMCDVEEKVIDCKAEAEAFDASSGAVPRANIMQTGNCMREALRGQGGAKTS